MLNTVRKYSLFFVVTILLSLVVSCSDESNFTQLSTTEKFNQNLNPELLDILWMVNDQSPMGRIRTHLEAQAQRLFQRLDGITAQYRMAIGTGDMKVNPGSLRPVTVAKSERILRKSDSPLLSVRLQRFRDLFSPTIINLRTSGIDEGLESARTLLNSEFIPQPNVPLVLIFISDADDSFQKSDKLSVEYYKNQFLALKNNNPDLLRLYVINYEDLPEGVNSSDDAADPYRCATRYQAHIDSNDFEDRYFELADLLKGETANLCDGNFADKIDLSGLRLSEPRTRFKLSQVADPGSISITVSKGGVTLSTPKYYYQVSTGEIVFEVAPVEGSEIVVTYLQR